MKWLRTLQDNFRYRLAHAGALPQLTVLGIISGLLTSVVAIAFRLCIELPLDSLLPGNSESFEALNPQTQFFLPMAGFTLIGVIGLFFKTAHLSTGVRHVIDRLHYHQSRLPLKNTLFQFLGGALSLLCGGPMGREGPAVHLGAGTSSLIGQYLNLPNNSLRVLSGCGVAAAISASFNTPLAGVIFAMEVVLMEYTITGFIPVILSSVIGALGATLVFGAEPAFSVPQLGLSSLLEIPYFVVCGLLIGLCASFMLRLYAFGNRFAKYPFLFKCTAAGLLCGSLSLIFPQIMGIGYDTAEMAMLGQIGLGTLLGIALCKLVAATLVASLGIPGGLIGPIFVIGACLGGALGTVGTLINPTDQMTSGFYAILGMAAMMGAVLNAPLAALIAVLELTYNPNILMPNMLVIVTACVTARQLTRLPGIFAIGQDIDRYASPVFQMLSRAGVTSLMNRNIVSANTTITWEIAQKYLASKPDWLVIDEPGQPKYILRPADLARYLEAQDKSLWEPEQPILLREIPGEQRLLEGIGAEATLQQALLEMTNKNIQAVYVHQPISMAGNEVAGIITHEDIDNYYH